MRLCSIISCACGLSVICVKSLVFMIIAVPCLCRCVLLVFSFMLVKISRLCFV